MSDESHSIKLAPDGPLLVSGDLPLEGAEGPIEAGKSYALCRCGASDRKPFCDGAHARTGFSGDKAADRAPDRVTSYEGERLTIHDNRGACAHAGVCTDRLPAVWRYQQEPWIDPDGATPEEVLAIVEACPSGALRATLKDTPPPAAEPAAARVCVVPDGPYAVQGRVPLEGVEFGEGTHATRYTLCRCGSSKNKPFCDGAHWHVKFRG